MKKLGLLPRLILGIILGIVIGNLNLPSIVRILATFNSIFGNFLGFTIPLIIVGFIIPGIADLGKSAGKLLGVTTLIAYCSTVIAGCLAFFTNHALLSHIISPDMARDLANPEKGLLHPFFRFFVKFWGAKVSMHSWRGHARKIVRILFRCVC